MNTPRFAAEQHELPAIQPRTTLSDEHLPAAVRSLQQPRSTQQAAVDRGSLPDLAVAQPLVFERLLRYRTIVWQQIDQQCRLHLLIWQLLRSAVLALCGYGLVIGIGHSMEQALAAAIKLPLLLLLTLAICLPALYLFNLIYGYRLSVVQVLALALAGITATSAVALAFVPIVLFFLITAQSHALFVGMNSLIVIGANLVGWYILTDGMKTIGELNRPERPGRITLLLTIWFALFAVVGMQLAWALGPFFGNPASPFTLFGGI